MATMTPWTYTDDMAQPFNVARALLGETDPATARMTDQAITTTLATFGWQTGMAVMAQRLIVEIGQEVIKYQENQGSASEWATQRLDGLKEVKAMADRGVLPDPSLGPVSIVVPGSIVLANQPRW